MGSAICRAGAAPEGGVEVKGKEGEEEVGLVQKRRRKPRGAAAAAALIVKAMGFKVKVKPWVSGKRSNEGEYQKSSTAILYIKC